MRTLLAVVLALWCGIVEAAVFNNSFTTNSPGKYFRPRPTTTSPLFPLMSLNPSGVGGDLDLQYSAGFFMSNNLAYFPVGATSGYVFTVDSAGKATWQPGIAAGSTGTVNTLAKWTSTNALGDSALSDDGAILLYTNGTFSFGPADGGISSFDIRGTTATNGSSPIDLNISGGTLDGSLNGPGGDIVLTGRDAVGTNDDNGGSIFIIGGLATGSGSPGSFDVNVPGDWSLTAGGSASLTAALLFDISAPIVTHDGAITLSGNTNQYTDNGTTLLRNGVAITGSETTATNIVTLTFSGATNISQPDFSLVARGGVFKLALTNNAFIGVPANVSSSTFSKAWLIVKNSGGFALTFSNAWYAWPEGIQGVCDTNVGSVSVYEMISDVWTSGVVHVSMTPLSKLP